MKSEQAPDAIALVDAVRRLLASEIEHESLWTERDVRRYMWAPAVDLRLAGGNGFPGRVVVAVAVAPKLAGQDGEILPSGTRLQIVGGTISHVIWPPETAILSIVDGPQKGQRIGVVLEPDMRPAGSLAPVCGALMIRADEPIFRDATRIRLLADQVNHHIADLDGSFDRIRTMSHESVVRMPADPGRSEVAAAWMKEGLNPAEWAARNAHLIGSFTFDEYEYADPTLDQWVQESGNILNTPGATDAARQRYLTSAERAEVERAELEPF